LPPWLVLPLWHICVTNENRYVPLVVITSAGPDNPIRAPEFIPVISGVRVTRYLVLYVCFVDRGLSCCPFFFWPLCCLFFFDIRLLITPLISSNSSYLTSDRNEVTAADNPKTNDTYEYIEGATSNQRGKGRNYNIDLLICKTCW
jgi:hypothetical protein